MKSIIQKGLRWAGVYAFRHMPTGASEVFELHRMSPPSTFRVIFDVGANVGEVSARYAASFPQATVYAFEPFPQTFADLSANVRGITSVIPVNSALGEESGMVQAVRSAGDGGRSSLRGDLDHVAGTPVDISVTTLDSFCTGRGIDRVDLLKTDTEGYDARVVRGARGLMERGAVRFVYAEVGFSREDDRHTSFFELHALLEPLGFYFVAMYEQRTRDNRWDFGNALFAHASVGRDPAFRY